MKLRLAVCLECSSFALCKSQYSLLPPCVGNLRALALRLRDHGRDYKSLSRWLSAPLRSLGVTALGRTLIPIQRSACDYAEVSLSLCTCYRLPRVATPILTYPLYRSLPKEVLARSKSTWLGILTPVQGTYPSVQYSTGCPKKVE